MIVNPSTPVGPRDRRPTPTGRMIVEAASGRIPAFVDTGLNLVHVDNVASGHVGALQHGRIGERYILGGQNMTLAELARHDRSPDGTAAAAHSPAARPLYPLAFAAEAMARVTKREPLLTVGRPRMSKHLMFFTSAKAERELGYRPNPRKRAFVKRSTGFVPQDACRDSVPRSSPASRSASGSISSCFVAAFGLRANATRTKRHCGLDMQIGRPSLSSYPPATRQRCCR